MEDAGKVCALCGHDCTNQPRVKDAKGRYYCRECYERASQKAQQAARRAAAADATTSAATGPLDALQDLARAEQTVKPGVQQSACPGCGATISGGVICMACGYDMRTGKRLALQVGEPARNGAMALRASVTQASPLHGAFQSGKPILFGCLGGIVGAVIWAAVAYGLDMQIGWLAIGVGALAGYGVRLGGGINPVHGYLAAAIAVAAICAGKIAAVHYAIVHSPEVRRTIEKTPEGQLMQVLFSEATYQEIRQKSEAFARINDKSQYAAFMVGNGYSDEEKTGDVTAEAIAEFEAEAVPALRQFHAENLTYEEWKEQQMGEVTKEIAANVTFWDMLKATTGLFDILIFLLAIGAAYRIAANGELTGG